MYAAFPRSEYYQQVRLPYRHLFPFGCFPIVHILGFPQDRYGSPRFLDVSISCHAVLSDPAEVSSVLAICERLLLPSGTHKSVGLRILPYEALSLHFRYGLAVALCTLNSCRYLHEPNTRFPVRRLHLLPGRESHPLKAPGLAWRTVPRAKSTEVLRIGRAPQDPRVHVVDLDADAALAFGAV